MNVCSKPRYTEQAMLLALADISANSGKAESWQCSICSDKRGIDTWHIQIIKQPKRKE